MEDLKKATPPPSSRSSLATTAETVLMTASSFSSLSSKSSDDDDDGSTTLSPQQQHATRRRLALTPSLVSPCRTSSREGSFRSVDSNDNDKDELEALRLENQRLMEQLRILQQQQGRGSDCASSSSPNRNKSRSLSPDHREGKPTRRNHSRRCYISPRRKYSQLAQGEDDDEAEVDLEKQAAIYTCLPDHNSCCCDDDKLSQSSDDTTASTASDCGSDNKHSNNSEHLQKSSSSSLVCWRDVWDRAAWLVGLLILQSLSSFIISRNERLLQKHLVIVQFLTMLVGAGGNAGNQSSVRVVRGLALGTIEFANGTARTFVKQELLTGLALAAVLGVAGCIRAAVFLVPAAETVAITVSLCLIVSLSIVLGTLLPLAMKWVGIDPANSSTTIQVLMDILGVTITVHVGGAILDSNFAAWIAGGSE